MPRKDGAEKRRRDRLIVLAAQHGASYPELAEIYGLTRACIALICIKAGHRRRAAWTDEMRENLRERFKTRRRRQA